jgi:AcrR family transcriptional regulator
MKKTQETVKRRQPGRPGKEELDGALLLLRAAETSFATLGFRSTTIRGIAQSAGVNHTLVIHHFGSKAALWRAVMERLALYLKPFLQNLRDLQGKTETPIRERLEKAFGLMVAATCGEPECGLLLSRIGSERGKSLDLLVEMLLRPFHDAFYPLLIEAAKAKVIKKQNLEMLYFMILNAVTTSVSYRHVLGYFYNTPRDIAELEKDVTRFLVVNFSC